MKKIGQIIIALSFIFFLGCNKSNKLKKDDLELITNNSKNKKVMTKDTLFLKEVEGNLSGIYFTEFIRPEKGFYLKKDKPKSDFILYKLNFKNGEIEFEDLTEFYDCGNGIFSLTNSTYKQTDIGNYKIEFNGEYALESSFKVIGEYKLTENNNGEKFLYPIKITENKRKEIFSD